MSKNESNIRKKIKVEPTLEDVEDMPIEYMNHNEKNLTKRQRLLVWNAVNDPTLTFAEAAKKAGFKNPKVVSRYMGPNGQYAHVYREYERLMAEAKKKFELTHEGAVEDLYRLRDDAWAQNNFTAAINAQNLLLKVGGLIVDRREVLHGKVDQMSRGEVERRLADLLGKQAIEHKSGIEIVDKSGSEEVGVIVGEEIVGDKKKEKKKRQVRPVPKEKEKDED
jgi:fructose-specific component phosphotransferase system IIB-like protein